MTTAQRLNRGFVRTAVNITVGFASAAPIGFDTEVEGSESLTVTLSSPTGAALGSPSTFTVSITDDDSAPAGALQFSTATYPIDRTADALDQPINAHYLAGHLARLSN